MSPSEFASRRVSDHMTPMPLVTASTGITNDAAAELLAEHRVEKCPSSTTTVASPG